MSQVHPPSLTWSHCGASLSPITRCRALDATCFLLPRNSCSPSQSSKPRRRSKSPELLQKEWMEYGENLESSLHSGEPHRKYLRGLPWVERGPQCPGPNGQESRTHWSISHFQPSPFHQHSHLTSCLPSSSESPAGPERERQ